MDEIVRSIMKLLAGCLVLLLGTVGCVKLIETESKTEMTRRSKNITNMVVRLHSCQEFLSKRSNVEYALQMACSFAGFDEDKVHFDYINSDLSTFTVYAYAGYAMVYASEKEKSLVLEFFAQDGFYSYPEFLGTFMEAFISLNNGECEVTYTNLLE